MIEYVISKDFTGASEAILMNGVSLYSKTAKAEYLADGFLVVDESGLAKAFDDFADRICGKWIEITEEQYEDALGVLPPAKWFDGGFFISELLVGDISAFYQRLKTRYFTSNQRMTTPREKIIESLASFMEEHLDVAFPTVLTKENAPYVAVIRNIANPDWGTKRFKYNETALLDGTYVSTTGYSVLFENEYSLWEVIRWK
jgi:hypothetical protein